MKKGFTLIELAIVVVVLGILIGGIVAGQSIVESAKVQKTTIIFTKLDTAVRAFQLEYGQIPGDFDEQHLYWPETFSSAYGAQGDKIIHGMGWCQRPTKSGSATCEDEAFWKHLELAEIWTDFSPKNQNCNGGNKEGVLELPFNGAYINPMSHNQTVYYNNHCVNNFYIGDPLISANNMYASEGVLTPIEAFKIDKKFDDGVSSSGKLMAASARNTNATDGCSSIAVNSLGRFAAGVGTSDYLKENEGKLCRMFYFSDVFK